MRILVTGGTGFTGTALVKRLLADGHDLTALDNKKRLQCDALRSMGVRVIIGSVTDADQVAEAMEGAEVVHHLAAAFREMDVEDEYYRKVNVDGTKVVLEAALKAGVKRCVYCSTCGVHGNIAHPPGGEDAPIAPADYYQRTKYEAEPIVEEYARRGLPSITLRPAAIYGPGDPERFFMIFKRVASGRFPMFGSGETLYHPLYIDNLVDALVLAMNSEVSSGRAYLIADEEYYSIQTIVEKVGQALNVPVKIPHYPVMPLVVLGHVVETVCKPFHIAPPIFPRRVDWFRQNRAFDISRAKAELNYKPAIGLDEGLRRTAQWSPEMKYL